MAWVKGLITLNSEYYGLLKETVLETHNTQGKSPEENFYELPTENNLEVFNDNFPMDNTGEYLLFETPTRKVYFLFNTQTTEYWNRFTYHTRYGGFKITDIDGNVIKEMSRSSNALAFHPRISNNTEHRATQVFPFYNVNEESEEAEVGVFSYVYDWWLTPPANKALITFMTGPLYGSETLYSDMDVGGVPDSDPYAPNGYANVGGGGGNFDTTSDIIGIPSAPTVSIVNSGFVSLYNPTQAQLANLAGYMWDNSFLTSLVKLRANPLDVIVSLTMLPCDIPSTAPVNMVIGNVDTLISMNRASSQYVDVSCGSLNIPHFYNSYLDYEPFTKAELYLPYIGVQTLSMDDIVGKTLAVLYRVDILTGACICYVTVDGNVMYTYSGQCGVSVPLSGENYNTLLSVLGTVTAGTVAIASSPTAVTVASNVLQGGNNVATMKPSFTRSGSISSNIGVLGVQKPYIIYTVPNVSLPENNNKFFGYPLNMTITLDELTGFTVVDEIRLDGLEVSEEERDRLREILKGGVVI